MIGMNIRMLRKKQKMSQESLAEQIGVSRQTVTKWENEETVPDIYACRMMADLLDVTLETLSGELSEEDVESLAPRGKQFFGVVKVGERGQIVIPKEARMMYQIQAGDKLVVLGEDSTKGIAILKSDGFLDLAKLIRKSMENLEKEEV